MNDGRQIVQADLGKLDPTEIELIWLIRTRFRFGNVEVITKDGKPVQILRTIERALLGAGVYPQEDIEKAL